MKQKTLGKLFPYLLILPSLVILAGVVFYPIAASLLRSFQLEEGAWITTFTSLPTRSRGRISCIRSRS